MQDPIPQEIIDLVIARIEESSGDRLTSFGNGKEEFTKSELISEIKKGSALGMKIVDVELMYLRAMASGELLRRVTEV